MFSKRPEVHQISNFFENRARKFEFPENFRLQPCGELLGRIPRSRCEIPKSENFEMGWWNPNETKPNVGIIMKRCRIVLGNIVTCFRKGQKFIKSVTFSKIVRENLNFQIFSAFRPGGEMLGRITRSRCEIPESGRNFEMGWWNPNRTNLNVGYD